MIRRILANKLERLSWHISHLAFILDEGETTKIAEVLYDQKVQAEREKEV